MVASFTIRAVRGNHQAQPTTHGWRVASEVRWLVEGPQTQLDEIEAALPARIGERVGAALVLRFGNAVGTFELPHIGRLDVHSRKWDDRHFDAMLADITARMATLPFATGTAAQQFHEREADFKQRILLHMFVYLRHICSPRAAPEHQVLPALRLVIEAPHRRLERTSEWAPLALARRVDPRGMVRIFAPQAGLEAVPHGTGGMLASALRGHLPQRVDESTVRHSVDVPENRFAKAFLEQMLGLVDRVRVLALRRRPDYLRRRLLLDCDEIERVLVPVRRHPLWAGVGAMHRLPIESTILQRRRGYCELFTQFLRLRMSARLPVEREQLEQLLEIKDIATLYEIWVFFAVEQAVSKCLGRGPDRAATAAFDDMQSRLPWDVQVAWGNVQLFYNLRFSRSRERRSYSLPLRPDVVMHVPHGPNAGLHLFDAKFRLDRIERLNRAGDEVDEQDEQDEQVGKFKHADVYKMHTYRDALPEARSAWVMYPGTEFGLYESGDDGRLVTDAGQLGSVVDGVGGVPAQPGTAEPVLARLVRAILGQHR